MNWDSILGHSEQVDMFRRSMERGRLAHSYLFVGADGIGKNLFATTLAQTLLCQESSAGDLHACGSCSSCKQVAAGSHPDLTLIRLPEGKSELPLDLIIGPKESRGKEGLSHEMALRPMAGVWKVAIIDDADHLNQESANALLKTLEEPPPHCLLILIVTRPDGVLPTIRSRCQLVRFAPLSVNDVTDLLVNNDVVGNRQEAETIAAVSQGSLTVATKLADPEWSQLRSFLYDHICQSDLDGLRVAVELTAGLDRLGGNTAEQRFNAGWLAGFCVEFYRLALLRLSGNRGSLSIPQLEMFLKRFDADFTDDLETIADLMERCLTAQQDLQRKVAIPLCLENLFDDLRRIGSRVAP